MKKNKLILIIAFIMVLFTAGFSYAFFTYFQVGSNENTLLFGDIYLEFIEDNGFILTNAFPETYEQAMTHNSENKNYMDFVINGINESNKTIYYNIILMYGDNINNKTRINDKDLAFSLEENGNVVVNNQSYETLNNSVIYSNNIEKNTNAEVNINYRLRMWLSDEVIISDTDSNADYSTSVYNNSYASVKVKVEAALTEPFTNVIKRKVGQDGIVAIKGGDSTAADYGDLYNGTNENEIREYRYSGLSENLSYCTYQNGNELRQVRANNGECQGYNDWTYVSGPTSGNVKNYVEFNNEIWRIIGVFKENSEENIRIVRDEKLTGIPSTLPTEIPSDYKTIQNPGKYYVENDTYGRSYYNLGGGVTIQYKNFSYKDNNENTNNYLTDNDWSTSGVNYYLNDVYYPTIDSKAKALVKENATYYLGNVTLGATTKDMYNQERSMEDDVIQEYNDYGQKVRWIGIVGLMYPSDYGYATYRDVINSTEQTNQYLNAWTHSSTNFSSTSIPYLNLRFTGNSSWCWFISPSSQSITTAAYLHNSGMVHSNGVKQNGGVWPVLTLKSHVRAESGDGTYANPYILG